MSNYFPFSSPEPTALLACGRNRELWEQPFWNNKGNNRILPIRFNAVCIYGACLKWLFPELSIPAAGQKDRRLWGREWLFSTWIYACAKYWKEWKICNMNAFMKALGLTTRWFSVCLIANYARIFNMTASIETNLNFPFFFFLKLFVLK